MTPIVRYIFSDNESLFDYERGQNSNYNASDLCNRLIALERQCNVMRNDTYYQGLGEMYKSKYSKLSDYFWKLPYELSKTFFLEKDKTLYLKCEKHNDWMDLISQIPPSFIISASLIDKFSNSLFLNKKSLSNFINTYLLNYRYTVQLLPYIPDLKFFVKHENGLKDLHIHLNGTTETDILWNYILQNQNEVIKEFTLKYNKSEALRKHSEQIISDFTPDKLNDRITDAKNIKKRLLDNIGLKILHDNNIIGDNDLKGNLSSKSYIVYIVNELCKDNKMIKEILFYLMVMSELRKSSNDLIAQQFHHYLLIKGLVHRFVVMQHSQKGFPQFQLITENTFRDGIESYYEQRFLQLSTGGNFNYLSLIEGRFSPKYTAFENDRLISKIIKGFESAKSKSDNLKDTKLALIAHFIKRKDEYSKHGLCRHSQLRKELKKKAIALSSFCKMSKYNTYLRGVDAAASEFDAGPEVFAQSFRYLRKQGIGHFTFHVGEDFRHIISGIRSIVEAVDFLDLQMGDRLGHCTALGISPALWANRICGECYISQGEWLDNLIFLYSFIKKHPNKQLQSLCLYVDSQISEYSYKVYGNNYPSYILEKAWKLRKFDPFLYMDEKQSFVDEWSNVDQWDVRESVKKDLSEKYVKTIYDIYHKKSKGCVDDEGYDKLIKLPVFDLLSSQDIEILQNLVLKFLSERGIVIETLPTSNLRISYYTDIEEYHLDRWLDSKHEKMLPAVVLGTDDPGIFMTNIYNEYARVYLYLQKKGYSVTCRMQHILDIHNNSKIYNFLESGD